MTFSHPQTLQRRLSRAAKRDFATVEIGHEDFQNGLIVKLEFVPSPQTLEVVLAHALELGATYPSSVRRLADPGWWAGVVAQASNMLGYPAAMVRGKGMRSRTHACLIVAHGSLLDAYPAFPRVRVGLRPKTQDLRGEACTSLGPSDDDLLRWREREGVEVELKLARQMFEVGALVFGRKDGELVVEAPGR